MYVCMYVNLHFIQHICMDVYIYMHFIHTASVQTHTQHTAHSYVYTCMSLVMMG
jgi:hypothetical protein